MPILLAYVGMVLKTVKKKNLWQRVYYQIYHDAEYQNHYLELAIMNYPIAKSFDIAQFYALTAV
jgi:hypothetical protein